jgi:hypothetical protein
VLSASAEIALAYLAWSFSKRKFRIDQRIEREAEVSEGTKKPTTLKSTEA